MTPTDDPYDLSRFVRAQEDDYAQALAELVSGRKRSHWMWYVFPQFDGLAFSSTSKLYSIKSVAEAKAYLAHPLLGPRLLECAEAVVRVEGRSATEIFGSPDDLKLKSCATLFGSLLPSARCSIACSRSTMGAGVTRRRWTCSPPGTIRP